MELLHNHQHSHVHSHVHLHPQNVPPPGGAVVPPSVAINDPVMNQYTALAHQALAVQQQHAALAAGLDPMQAGTILCKRNEPGVFYHCIQLRCLV